MNATWVVARYHFKREVFKKAFLLTLFSLPLFLLFIYGFARLIESFQDAPTHLGVVDPGGFLKVHSLPGRDAPPELQFFASQEDAVAALEADDGSLHAVYVLPAAYPADRTVQLLYNEYPTGSIQEYFADLLRANLLADKPPDLAQRVIDGSEILIRATATHREFPASNPTTSLFIPLILAVVYIFSIIPVAGIMMGSLGEEKANRTIEVIITSISPRSLLGGKILAVTGVALLQITVWLGMLALAVWIGGAFLGVPWLQDVQVSWRDAAAIGVLAVPGYAFYGATLVMFGSLIDDAETLQQASGLVMLPLFLPVYVLPALLETPDSPLALALSLIPLTSVQTIGIQSIFMEVPLGRLALAAVVSSLCAAGMVWLAARAFRLGLLRYGKRIRFGELFRRGKAA